MLERLSPTCEDGECDRALSDDALMLEMERDGGVRRAYECDCGAVTVTVVKRSRYSSN
ncbi:MULTISPECIES: hypothetical protein [Halostella]|uniref:hypothetical protein n=1 Tax=Halostella TaxID=1843185 RepID=UPI00143D1B6D|nr:MULTISPECIES: hypothetical protein [Halostella]